MQIINDTNISILKQIYNDYNIIIPICNESPLDRTKIDLIAIFIYNIPSKKDYIINLKHNDFLRLSNIPDFHFTDSLIYRYELLSLKGTYDINLFYWWVKGTELYIEYPEGINFYKKLYRHIDFRYVPMTLIYQYCQDIKKAVLGIADVNYNKDNFKIYHENVFEIFKKIERPGCLIDKTHPKAQKISGDRMISNYKMTTTTGRPSNTYDHFNMAAMNKDDGTRKLIIPDKNSILLEFDYSAFHIRLISKLINFDLPNGNLHDYFGRQYFQVPFLSPEQYEETKSISFRAVYGFNTKLYIHIPFYAKLYKFREKLLDEYKRNGFIQSVIYKRPIGLNQNLPENKLFNYLLQSYETEFNSSILNQIFNYLYKRKSKIILYTYDSLLINLTAEDKLIIKDLTSIIFNEGLTGTVKVGRCYDDLKPLNKDKYI